MAGDTAQLWQPAATHPVLLADDVHIWRARLDQPAAVVEKLAQHLSADELSRAESFVFAGDRMRYIIGRGTLRMILARYLDCAPGQPAFCYGPRGKPELVSEANSHDLRFNLSHSQALVLFAFTTQRKIGIDVEFIRPVLDAEQIVKEFFSEREKQIYAWIPPDQKQAAFFKWWTRKEAYIKALGDGLAHPLNTFDVTFTVDEPPLLLLNRQPEQQSAIWSLQAIAPAPGYTAAVAVEGENWRYRYFAMGDE